MNKRLTEAQQKIVEENHNLIYSFAIKKGLPIDEYYDLLALGLCEAAQLFDPSKGKFSTFAYIRMRTVLDIHRRYNERKSMVPKEIICSYNSLIGADKHVDTKKEKDNINLSTHDIAINNIVVAEFLNILTEKEKMAIQHLMDGRSYSETAEIMDCKKQNIGYYVKQIRKKWNEYIG